MSEKLRILESIVKTPIYALAGYTHGKIIYVSTEEGVVSLWSLDVNTLVRTRLTREPIHSVTKPTPKSKLVVFTRDVSRGRELQKIYSVNVEERTESLLADIPPIRVFGIAYDGVKASYVGATREGIGLYLVEKEGSYEKLVDLNAIAWPTDISGEYIVGSGLLKGDPRTMELFVFNLSTGELKVYTPKEGSVNKEPIAYGSKLLFESNFEGIQKLYIYDVESEELSEAKMEYSDYGEYKPVEHVVYGWTDRGEVWAVGKRNGRSEPFINGKLVPSPQGYISNMVVVNGKAYYTLSTLVTPPKIYEAELDKGYRVVLDNSLPREVSEKLGEAYFVKYKSKDELEIPMYVIESRTTSKPGPSIVYVHGGPWSEVVDGWSIMIAGIVASGYHVLAPNFRGSTGYGEEFRLKDIGDPGGRDLEDVVAARN